MATTARSASRLGASTSVDKAFDVCEVLSGEPDGMSLTDLARALKQPRPSVHRLLTVLRRRGYVRQDEESQRYSLSVKMLDLCFRLMGRSELRLHALPVLRDYAVHSGYRTFVAVPSAGETTYVWNSAPGGVAMHPAYGREMPAHCAKYFDETHGSRRLSCLRLADARDVSKSAELLRRLGPATPAASSTGPGASASAQRLFCTCAPVFDYRGREAARVGVFGHGADDRPITGVHNRGAWELARHVSLRLGYLSAVAMGVS